MGRLQRETPFELYSTDNTGCLFLIQLFCCAGRSSWSRANVSGFVTVDDVTEEEVPCLSQFFPLSITRND